MTQDDGTASPSLRPVSPFDVALLAELHARSFDPAWGPGEIASLLASPGSFGLLAGRGAAPIGFLLGRAVAGEAEILSLGILPEERRRGAGRALVAAAIDHATRAGATRLFLEVADDNLAARALYDTAGFRRVGRRVGYYRRAGGPVSAQVLERALSGSGAADAGSSERLA
ncbi:MAG: GNAT family N-acetyltransferase [Dongiaceae bacterium]